MSRRYRKAKKGLHLNSIDISLSLRSSKIPCSSKESSRNRATPGNQEKTRRRIHPSQATQIVLLRDQLMKRRDKFDYVLVETTGLAGPVAQTFFMDDEIRTEFALDGIVTLEPFAL